MGDWSFMPLWAFFMKQLEHLKSLYSSLGDIDGLLSTKMTVVGSVLLAPLFRADGALDNEMVSDKRVPFAYVFIISMSYLETLGMTGLRGSLLVILAVEICLEVSPGAPTYYNILKFYQF